METFSERLLFLIENQRLKRSEFAEAIGITPPSLSLLISGRNNPSNQTIKAICDNFGCRREWLVDGAGDPFPPMTQAEEIGHIAKAAAGNNPEEAAAFFRNLLGDLDPAEILLLYEIFRKHFPPNKKED